MRFPRSVLVLALSVAVVGSCSAAPSVFLKLKANGNDLPGDSSVVGPGRENTIECLSFDMGVVSPRGPGGQATGRRGYQPITITKRVDRASVLLLKAITQNETCECEFRFYRTSASGAEQHFYTVSLQHAYIASVRQFVEPSEPGTGAPAQATEEVSWVFGDIKWTFMDGGIEHSDEQVQAAMQQSAPGTAEPGPQPGQPGLAPRKPALRLPETRRVGPQH